MAERKAENPSRRVDDLHAPVPGILDDDEREEVEDTFGVDSEQVVRDHVISHTLAAIGSVGTDEIVFFGG